MPTKSKTSRIVPKSNLSGILTRTLLLALTAAAWGCGSAADGGSSGDGFIGTWKVISGDGSYMCHGSISDWPNPATLYILAGSQPNEVVISNPDGVACTTAWTVSGANATLLVGTCSPDMTIQSGTATILASGELRVSFAGTTTDPCTTNLILGALRTTN